MPGGCSNSCPLSRWCHPTISSFVVPLSSRLQSFPVSGSFLRTQLFTSGGQSTGVSLLASVLLMNILDWFPLGLTGWILQSKGLSTVFSNTAVQKHQFIYLFIYLICSEFCHILKWSSHGLTCVPHPNPPSHVPLHPLPLGLPRAPGPSACLMHPTWAGDLFHPR